MKDAVETIDVPHRRVKPDRFDIVVLLNGVTWRRVHVEIAADEGQAAAQPEQITTPLVTGFGLPTPVHLVCLSMRYQIAQKIHACTDLHDPPHFVNDRPRDVDDLLLLRDLINGTRAPQMVEVRAAGKDVFVARAREAEATAGPVRTWPTPVTAYSHWGPSFAKATKSAAVATSSNDAVAQVNDWVGLIAHAPDESEPERA